jgi:hypothetical protein
VEEQVAPDGLVLLRVAPISRGARWSFSSATMDEPPVPMVYV